MKAKKKKRALFTKKQERMIQDREKLAYDKGYCTGAREQYVIMNREIVRHLEEKLKLYDRIKELENTLKNQSAPGAYTLSMDRHNG